VGDRSLGVFATPGALAAGAPLIVVEGPADALSFATCEVPAVALVGTRAPRWLRTAAAFRRVLVGLDADAEGDNKAGLLADELAPFARTVERLRPPEGKDWNDALLGLGYGARAEWLTARGLGLEG
jgi:DNA primase